MSVVEGYVAFCNVLNEDEYRGQYVGFNVTLCLEDSAKEALESEEVIVKEYHGVGQRKFKSKSQEYFDILDADGKALKLSEELPRGTKVRLLWNGGKDVSPQYGRSTYLSKLKVLEMGDGNIPLAFEGGDDNNDF